MKVACRFNHFLIAVPILLSATAAGAQHLHFVAGAPDTNQNTKLIAVNGAEFLSTSGYVRTLSFSNNGTYAGYYNASSPFIVAAATAQFGGPEPEAPAFGSFIQVELVSVEGPAGAEFGHWEAVATRATFSLSTGTTSGANRWDASEASLGAGAPGADPFGHVHGRRFTATKPGFYTVGFRFMDVSTNGVSGGPIHAPSDVFYVYMQADLSIHSVTRERDNAIVQFGATAGKNYALEFCPNVGGSTQWSEVGGPVTGDDHLQSITHTNASVSQWILSGEGALSVTGRCATAARPPPGASISEAPGESGVEAVVRYVLEAVV